jgi:ankyrin repeat protein
MAHERLIEFLVSQGIPVDAVDRHGNSALHEAVAGDWENPLALQILLEHGANPNIKLKEGGVLRALPRS